MNLHYQKRCEGTTALQLCENRSMQSVAEMSFEVNMLTR